MLQISAPHFRSLNANLMLFAGQAGFFLGPVLGVALVANWNYHGYFLASSCLVFGAGALTVVLAVSSSSRRFNGDWGATTDRHVGRPMNLNTGTIAGQLHDFPMIMEILRPHDEEVSRIGIHVNRLDPKAITYACR